jgi:hypothetical protein
MGGGEVSDLLFYRDSNDLGENLLWQTVDWDGYGLSMEIATKSAGLLIL